MPTNSSDAACICDGDAVNEHCPAHGIFRPKQDAARIHPGTNGVNIVQEEGPVEGVPEPGGLPAANPDGSAAKSHRLRGEVVKLTFRRGKRGVRHWTRIEFEQPSDFKSVALSGVIAPEHDPETRLLEVLRERYDVSGLPEPRWSE